MNKIRDFKIGERVKLASEGNWSFTRNCIYKISNIDCGINGVQLINISWDTYWYNIDDVEKLNITEGYSKERKSKIRGIKKKLSGKLLTLSEKIYINGINEKENIEILRRYRRKLKNG